MSVDPFDTGGATRKRRPALRGTVMLDVSMGKARVRVWPKKRGKAKTAAAKKLQDDFRQASWACKYWDPRNIMSVDEMRKGTPVLIRDLQIMMMYNRFANFSMNDGRMVYTVQARQDVSDSLDTICPLPGALLIRTPDGWRFVEPPTGVGQQLVSTAEGLADWETPVPVVSSYQLIQTQTLGAPAATIDFTGIPAATGDLILKLYGRETATGGAFMSMRFNGDAGANYDYENVSWFNSAQDGLAAAFGQTSLRIAQLSPTAAVDSHQAGSVEIIIPGFAGTVFKKRAQAHWSLSTGAFEGVGLYSGEWRSLAAINAIKLLTSAGSFGAGTTASLYHRT